VRLRLKSVIAGSLLCAACGPISKLPPLAPAEIEAEQRKQQIDQVRDYFAQRGRLHDVAFRIRAANHRDCENRVQADIGLSAGTVESLPRKFRSFAHEALSVSWTQATVLSVAGNSPAPAAGDTLRRSSSDVQQRGSTAHRSSRMDRRLRAQQRRASNSGSRSSQRPRRDAHRDPGDGLLHPDPIGHRFNAECLHDRIRDCHPLKPLADSAQRRTACHDRRT
jgi:hypothetical protein